MTKRNLLILLGAICSMLLVLTIGQDLAGQLKPKDTYILKGAPMGGVKFDHKAHSEVLKVSCETCHHASKPEKPAKAAQEACSDCHTKPPQPGMKTGWNTAFHALTGQTGLCIDCHKKETAAGKKPPTKCLDCHKKENI